MKKIYEKIMSSLKYILYDIINILAIFAIYIYIFTNNINSNNPNILKLYSYKIIIFIPKLFLVFTKLLFKVKKICNI